MKIALQQHTSVLTCLDSSLFQYMKRERVEVGQTAGWLADWNGWACFLLLYYTLDLSVLCLNEDQHDHLEHSLTFRLVFFFTHVCQLHMNKIAT